MAENQDAGYSVGDVAALAGVSVRTLHHYDRIGLLLPSGRTPAGYRQYSLADLERLRQILYYRALGFGLDEIAQLLVEPNRSAQDHLREQHRLVRNQIAQRQTMLAAIEKEMEARQMGISLTPEEQFEVFGENHSPDWTHEAQERWGETDAWKESQRRTTAYTKQDWVEIKAESDANEAAFVAALRAGEPADSGRVMKLAEALRRQIDSRFYDCDHDMHRALADMYLADPRFTKHYEDVAPGLAQYVHDAIYANADAAMSR
jgi:MerR family transcriptional regulator, thiopeptide resistance regulator